MKALLRPVLLSALLCGSAFAGEPWEGAAFTADPKAMLAAAEAVKPAKPDEGVIVLLDEAQVTFDASGRSTRVERLVYRILNDSGVEGWSTIATAWSPWYHERPAVDARVIARDGTVHRLDPKSFGLSDATDEPDMFSDTRVLSGPLPAVAPGSVVERTITWREKNPLATAGTTDRHGFGNWVETRQTRLVLEWPSAVSLRTVNRTSPAVEPRKTESDGVTRMVFESGPLPGFDFTEWNVPADEYRFPYVAWSTGKSWQEVATRYAAIVDEKIGDLGAVDRITRTAIGDAKAPREIAARLLAAVERDIRYAGVEFGEGSIMPRTPSETLKNKYGDCKDKATLLVAMLRRAGVPAHVVLLHAGIGTYDVEPDLPGLGYFNHVIVAVDGPDPFWIDPTDEFARAGELPDSDQGRLALIAKPETTALTLTPVDEARANRTVETIEFTLAEDGKAHVVETSEYFGSDERANRRSYTTSDQKGVRESLENYAKQTYLAKALAKWETGATRDLTKPFRIRLEIDEAGRGSTGGGEAAVGIFLSRLVGDLSEDLRTEPDEKDPDYKPRRHDYALMKPYVLERHYVITPPPGYAVRTVPENETLKLGTVTLTKAYRLREDGVLLADYTSDSGPRRLTAAQFEETRRAVAKVANAPSFLLYFDQLGRRYLDAGEVGKAVAELRRLVALHPKEALHHADVARALLAGGMGAAARREAQRAIEVEPKSAAGHTALGFVLTHDLIGRELRKGCDVAAAIAAYRKAKELAPESSAIRAELAMVLQHNAAGTRYAKDAHLNESIDEYLAMKKGVENVNLEAIDRELMTLYAYTGRWDDLKKLLAETKDTERKDVYQLVAAAASEGGDAALKAAQSLEPAKRRTAETTAAGFLAMLRVYPPAAALLADAAQGAPNASQLRTQADLLRKTVRFEERRIDPADPKSIWYQATIEFARTGQIDSMEKFSTADVQAVFVEEGLLSPGMMQAAKPGKLLRQMEKQGDFLADIALSAIEIQQDGNESVGYRLRGRALGATEEGLTLYVVRENSGFRAAGTYAVPPGLALHALRLAEQNDLAGARQWLDWARDHVTAGYENDPLRAQPFAALWTRGKEATLDEARLAAAVLLPYSKRSSEIALPILTAARANAPADVQTRIDQALLVAYRTTSNWSELLATADRLAKDYPDSARAFTEAATALDHLSRRDEIRTRASARLQRLADDPEALQALARLALERSAYTEAMTYYTRLLDRTRPTSNDYNQFAWTSLFAGADLDKAVEYARQGVAIHSGYAVLNTLAVLYAEQGKSSEARDTLLASLEEGEDNLQDADWYVVGRIAENYGIRDVAIEAYQHIGKPAERTSSPWELAQKRLAALK